MTDQCLAEDIARLLLGGAGWEERDNVQRIAALAIAFEAVSAARATGLRTAPVVPFKGGTHDDAA